MANRNRIRRQKVGKCSTTFLSWLLGSWVTNESGEIKFILEKTLMLGKIEGGRRRGWQGWDGWMASPTQWTWVWASSRSWLMDREAWPPAVHGVQRVRHIWVTEPNWTYEATMIQQSNFLFSSRKSVLDNLLIEEIRVIKRISEEYYTVLFYSTFSSSHYLTWSSPKLWYFIDEAFETDRY